MLSVDSYFNDFLRARIGVPLVPGYETYAATFSICFTDRGQVWRIEVGQGRIRSVAEVPEAGEGVVFTVDTEVFEDIVRLRTSPQQAFFAGRTNIEGSLFDGMKLAKVLALFFAAHPYTGESGPT